MRRFPVWPLPAALGAALLAALALGRGAPLLRMPEDLIPNPNAPSRAGDIPLHDGTPRTIRAWSDGYLPTIARGEERLAVPLPHGDCTLLGASQGIATYAKATLPASPRTRQLTLLQVGVAENPAPRRTMPVPLPDEILTVEDLRLSPDGCALAWSVTTRREKPGVGILRRLLPRLVRTVPPRYAVELWRSDADGKNLRPIASAPTDLKPGTLKVAWEESGKLVALWRQKPYSVP